MAVIPTGRPNLRTEFKKARTIGPLYTSGAVAITQDCKRLVTCVAEDILLTDVDTGVEICRFAGDTHSIHSLCITPSSSHLIVFTSSLSLRIYELPSTKTQLVQPIRIVNRAHEAPVHTCVSDPTSTYLASGSADGVVKVWNILGGFVTHVFKGHGGVVSALLFRYPQDPSSIVRNETMHLISASVDTRIRIFNLTQGSSGTGKPEADLEGHVSVPRGLDVSHDGRWLISAGRDSVVLVWDLLANVPANTAKKKSHTKRILTPKLFKTIPVLERLEAVGILQNEDKESKLEGLNFYTGGEKGVVRVWNAKSGAVTQQLGNERHGTEDIEEQRQIMNILHVPSASTLVSIHADQNIFFYSLAEGCVSRQLIGYNDEVVDATFLHYTQPNHSVSLPHDTHIALATNSSLIRVYSVQDLDSRLLEGHSEIVLALDHSADRILLASGSKDKTARVWAPVASVNSSSRSWSYICIGICEGHTESVGAIAMAREGDDPTFMFSGSQDRTIKMWDISGVRTSSSENATKSIKSLTTHVAHDKDINSLDVSPNDKFLASGSQDRTAKIFEIHYIAGREGAQRGDLKRIGTFKGHKRGVWSVRFGKSERLLATGSGDKTVKLWSLDDYSCLKTFEGHSNSVLRVDFFNAGLQLVSTASDGLVKLWNIRDEECVGTLDNHEDKVWALALSSDERTIVSGAADSVVTFWEDCTEEVEAQKEATRVNLVMKEQDFHNFVALHDYRRALELALSMSQPSRLFSLFKDVASENQPNSLTGNGSVDEVLRTLAGPDLVKLLVYIRDWNTKAKTSPVAQRVLYAIFKLRTAEDIMKAFREENVGFQFTSEETNTEQQGNGRDTLKELVEGLVPYSERHLSRMNKLLQESYVLDYMFGQMDDGLFDGDLDADSNMLVD